MNAQACLIYLALRVAPSPHCIVKPVLHVITGTKWFLKHSWLDAFVKTNSLEILDFSKLSLSSNDSSSSVPTKCARLSSYFSVPENPYTVNFPLEFQPSCFLYIFPTFDLTLSWASILKLSVRQLVLAYSQKRCLVHRHRICISSRGCLSYGDLKAIADHAAVISNYPPGIVGKGV